LIDDCSFFIIPVIKSLPFRSRLHIKLLSKIRVLPRIENADHVLERHHIQPAHFRPGQQLFAAKIKTRLSIFAFNTAKISLFFGFPRNFISIGSTTDGYIQEQKHQQVLGDHNVHNDFQDELCTEITVKATGENGKTITTLVA